MELTIRVGERMLVSYGDIGYTKKSKASNVNILFIICEFCKIKTFINKNTITLTHMIKEIRIILELKDYEKLKKQKKELTWRQFLMRVDIE